CSPPRYDLLGRLGRDFIFDAAFGDRQCLPGILHPNARAVDAENPPAENPPRVRQTGQCILPSLEVGSSALSATAAMEENLAQRRTESPCPDFSPHHPSPRPAE